MQLLYLLSTFYMIKNNEMGKDSGISRNNHHNLLMGRVTARYAMEWMTLCRVGTRRGVSEPLVPVVVVCERSELYTASDESTKGTTCGGTAGENDRRPGS